MTDEGKVSDYAERASTREGRSSLAAARLALRISDLLQSVKVRSGRSSKQIADQLEVTEGRISQILNGSGNLHVATIARFLSACDFELSVQAVPFGLSASSNRREKKGRSQDSPTRKWQSWHIYAQDYVTSSGVSRRLDVVDGDVERPIPLGEPVHMGSLSRHESFTFDVANDVRAWQQKTANALEHEGLPQQKVPVS